MASATFTQKYYLAFPASKAFLVEESTFVVAEMPDSESNVLEPGEEITLNGDRFDYYYSGTITQGPFSGIVYVDYVGDTYILTNDSLLEGSPVDFDPAADFALCFLPGTRIATPAGDVAIETLRAGDLVLTAEGEAKPVRWLARQSVSTRFANPLRVLPIRIQAGALGENLPERDLFVSPDHALLVEGLLVQAGALVNGTTIVRHTAMPQLFVYYHVELEDHSLVLAEGVPAETFVDNVSRRAFDNWREAPEAAIEELPLPRVKAARQLPSRLRAHLAERVAALGAREHEAA